MNEQMESIYVAFLNNQVPALFYAYPSLKPLASWVADLRLRLLFIQRWVETGKVNCYWMSGFYYTQGKWKALIRSILI